MKKGLKLITLVFAFIGLLAVLLILSIILLVHNKKTFTVSGPGMRPTLQDGQMVTTTVYKSDELPQRGDIIIFKSPDKTQSLVKRVIALPGERVVIAKDGLTVYNNETPNGFNPDIAIFGKAIDTPGNIDITLSSNSYFVLGDNRQNSLDSRIFGAVPLSNILGKVRH